MGWIINKSRTHECKTPKKLPFFRTVRDGDEWWCRSCRKVWRVTIISVPPVAGYSYELRWNDTGKEMW
jgi:hypothetical protein